MKYGMGEVVTYRDLAGNERTGEVWSLGSQNAQRWVTTPDRQFALLTFAKPSQFRRFCGDREGLREVRQNWRGVLRDELEWRACTAEAA